MSQSIQYNLESLKEQPDQKCFIPIQVSLALNKKLADLVPGWSQGPWSHLFLLGLGRCVDIVDVIGDINSSTWIICVDASSQTKWWYPRRADNHGDFYQHSHFSELKFFAGDRRCFLGINVTKSQLERWEDRRCSAYNCSIFFLI